MYVHVVDECSISSGLLLNMNSYPQFTRNRYGDSFARQITENLKKRKEKADLNMEFTMPCFQSVKTHRHVNMSVQTYHMCQLHRRYF